MLRAKDGFDAGSRNERRKRLLFELLKEKNINKLYYYSNKFKVNEATISGDLKEAQIWLAQYGLQIVNPILDSVKEEYAQIYQRCICVAQVMEKWLGQKIPEAEIAFLAVHFGAAMMRLEAAKEECRIVNMGLVCSNGIGVSRLMSTKIAREFRNRVKIKVYGTKDVTPYIASKTDFFISSVPMEMQETPVIFVNPLLSEEDMEHIRTLVCRFEHTPKKTDSQEDGGRMELMHTMAEQVRLLVEHMVSIHVKIIFLWMNCLRILERHFLPIGI